MEEVECVECVDHSCTDEEANHKNLYQSQNAHITCSLCVSMNSSLYKARKTAVGDLTTKPVPIQDNIDPLPRTPNH